MENNFKKINLETKEIFNKYPAKYVSMEFNFCILYIWQEMMDTCYAQIDDALVFRTTKLKPFFAQPKHLYTDEPVLPLFLKLKEMPFADEFSMRCITTDYLNKLKAEGFKGSFFKDDDYAEYVYLQSDLASLAGKKYTQKRNHINKLLNDYSFEYLAYDDSMKTEVINLFDEWAANSKTDRQNERNALMRALNDREELNIQGGVILHRGEISAFALGTPGDDEMYCVLFEKARNINGLYQLINREFSKTLSEYKYINRQEDMGIEGLKHAKRSYHPVFMIDKYGI